MAEPSESRRGSPQIDCPRVLPRDPCSSQSSAPATVPCRDLLIPGPQSRERSLLARLHRLPPPTGRAEPPNSPSATRRCLLYRPERRRSEEHTSELQSQ